MDTCYNAHVFGHVFFMHLGKFHCPSQVMNILFQISRWHMQLATILSSKLLSLWLFQRVLLRCRVLWFSKLRNIFNKFDYFDHIGWSTVLSAPTSLWARMFDLRQHCFHNSVNSSFYIRSQMSCLVHRTMTTLAYPVNLVIVSMLHSSYLEPTCDMIWFKINILLLIKLFYLVTEL